MVEKTSKLTFQQKCFLYVVENVNISPAPCLKRSPEYLSPPNNALHTAPPRDCPTIILLFKQLTFFTIAV